MTNQAVALLAALLLAHYLGDFTRLSTRRMLEAKASGGSPPWILAHAGVHAVLVGLAVAVVAAPTWLLVTAAAATELITHFALDAGRSKLSSRFPLLARPDRDGYWRLLGVDQLAHALVLLAIAAMVIRWGG